MMLRIPSSKINLPCSLVNSNLRQETQEVYLKHKKDGKRSKEGEKERKGKGEGEKKKMPTSFPPT